jgi:hypothetical protein
MSALDVFSDVPGSTVHRYRVTIRCRGLLVGGVPSDESVIRKWLESRMDLDKNALDELVQKTLRERGMQPEGVPTAEIVDALVASPQAPSINGFKRLPDGELAWESRCWKAAVKEACNSAYPGTDWEGKASAPYIAKRKGLMATAAERIFVEGDLLGLGVKEPTRVEERIKHVMTASGPRSAVASVEVVDRPTITGIWRVHDDFLGRAAWKKIFERAEDIGIGADRGRSDGQFDLLEFTPIETPARAAAPRKRTTKTAA